MTTSEYQQKKEEILTKYAEHIKLVAEKTLKRDFTETTLPDGINLSTAIDNLILDLIGEDEPVNYGNSPFGGGAVVMPADQEKLPRNQLKASLRNIVKGSKE